MKSRIYFEKFITREDFKFFLKLASNEKVMKMNYGRVFTLEESVNYYSKMLENNKVNEAFGAFKVFERGTKAFLGMGALILNEDLTEAEVEYLLLPEFWHRGYGTEIVKNLLEQTGVLDTLQQVVATIDPNNIASKKILVRNGFKSQRLYKVDDDTEAELLVKKVVYNF